jgi:hypothetical protein
VPPLLSLACRPHPDFREQCTLRELSQSQNHVVSFLEEVAGTLLCSTPVSKSLHFKVVSLIDLYVCAKCICRKDEGVKVVVVNDIPNPYRDQGGFDMRFMFTLNKIYAWSLTEYQRVVMLDADNLFLQKTDELFQCGQFCAAFINPCIFHTGLFVLEACKLNHPQ